MTAALEATPEPSVVVHAPVDVRSVSLGVLAVLAGVYMARWAGAVFIPLVLGLTISYALSPIVNRLQRWRIPRAVGAAVLLIGIIAGAGGMAYSLSDDATSLIETLPEAAQKLRVSLHRPSATPAGTIGNVQKAAAELERAADESAGTPAPGNSGVTKVEIQPPRFNVKDYMWTGTLGLVAFTGQAAIVVLIAYFLLVSGDTFRRKMLKLAGPKLSRKRITLEALDEITEQIQRYLLVQLFTSAIVGIATWLVFAWIGLQHAAVWGVAAAVTNLVPYLGAAIIGAGSAVVGFMQFGTIEMALVTGGVVLRHPRHRQEPVDAVADQSRGRMNPVAVFVGVLAWGWLWGAWGLLLGVPILMAVKAVCDRVEDLKPVGELLGS